MSVERGASTARRAMGEGRRASGAALPLLGLALVTSGGTALLLLLHHRVVAGVLALVGAASLLFGSAVARASGQRRELLAELLADRVFDASVLAPVAWVTRSASPPISITVYTTPDRTASAGSLRGTSVACWATRPTRPWSGAPPKSASDCTGGTGTRRSPCGRCQGTR